MTTDTLKANFEFTLPVSATFKGLENEGFQLLTEAGERILTEDSNDLLTEAAPGTPEADKLKVNFAL